jgi:hypothetical protein
MCFFLNWLLFFQARTLRNGKVYAQFMAGDNSSVVISDFRLANLFARHDIGPQEETHDDLGYLSDLTDLDDNDNDDKQIPACSVCPPSAAEEPRRRRDSPLSKLPGTCLFCPTAWAVDSSV